MKFTICNIDNLTANIEKIERYYAFKYEAPKQSIALIIRGKIIHILVYGKIKESITPDQLLLIGIDEDKLEIIKTTKLKTLLKNGNYDKT